MYKCGQWYQTSLDIFLFQVHSFKMNVCHPKTENPPWNEYESRMYYHSFLVDDTMK